MLIDEKFLLILLVIPIYQLLYYTVQLFSFNTKNPARYLGYLMLSMTLFLITNALITIGHPLSSMLYYFAFFPLLLIIAPFLYLFVMCMSRQDKPALLMRLQVFVPAFLVFVIHLTLFLMVSHPKGNLTFLKSIVNPESSYAVRTNLLIFISFITFLFIQLFIVAGNLRSFLFANKNVESSDSIAFINPLWIKLMAVGVLVFIVSGALINLFGQGPFFALFNIIMLIGGGITGSFALKTDNFLRQVNLLMPERGDQPRKKPVKALSAAPICPIEAEQIKNSIEQLMEMEKPFCKCTFSLGDLCDMLDINKRKVSYVINEIMQKNFYSLVNEYRIEESIQLLHDPDSDRYKMEAIAEMAGFSSKSTFYACFRKFTSMTPTEYRETIILPQVQKEA